MDGTVEVWRGGVAAWECDVLGHLNVGHYVGKAMEALAGMAAELGMPHAFSPEAGATVLVREHHIRFLREARAGASLSIDAGVLELGETDARLVFLMRHQDGGLAATVQMRVIHATTCEAQPFPWPARVRDRAAALRVALPPDAAARSVTLGPIESRASLARAHELGLQRIALGAIRPSDCDPFGRMRAEILMARISDGVGPVFVTHSSADPANHGRFGVIALEYRLIYLAWPRMGDRFELRSGVLGGDATTRTLVHWFLDPTTGEPWGAAEAVTAAFDLEARRLIRLDAASLGAWREAAIPGLSI